MKNLLKGVLLAGAAVCFSMPALAAETDPALMAALAGPQRAPENAARDGWRHPYETLTFFGIKPTMTVVELFPEGGWYTNILAPYLHDHGKLIGAQEPATPTGAPTVNFNKKLAAHPKVYDKVQ